MAEARVVDDGIVDPGSVTDFSSVSIGSSSSDSCVAYDSDGKPAMGIGLRR